MKRFVQIGLKILFLLTFYALFTESSFANSDSLLIRLQKYLENNNYDSLFFLIKKTKNDPEFTKDKANMIHLLILENNAYINLNNFKKSLEVLNYSLDLLDTNKDLRLLSEIYSEFSALYYQMDEKQKALRYIKKAYKLMKRTDTFIPSLVMNYGVLVYWHNPDSALEFYSKEVKNLDTLTNYRAVIYLKNYIGHFYLNGRKYNQAIKAFRQSYLLSLKHKMYYEQAINLSSIAYIYLLTRNLDSALYYNNLSYKIAKTSHNIYIIKEDLETYMLIYYKLKDIEKYHRARILRDSINEVYFGMETKKELAKIEYNYKLKLLKKNMEIRKNRYRTVIVVLWLLIVIILLFIRYLHHKNKVKILLKEQKIALLKEENEKLDIEINAKKKDLLSKALIISKFNSLNEKVIEELKKLSLGLPKKKSEEIKKIIREISLSSKMSWDEFFMYFNELFSDFISRLKAKYPDLTKTEYKIVLLIRLNMNTKDIANITFSSVRTIEKHRQNIRKKLNLPKEVSLDKFIREF